MACKRSAVRTRYSPQKAACADSLLYIIMFSVYIIYSAKLNKYYTGYSEDVNLRLMQHNTGISTFTSKAADWELKYQENFETREAAHKKELEIKNKKSRKYIEWLINNFTG